MASKHFDLDTNNLLGGNNPSDVVIASQKATKTYIDNQIKTLSNAGYSIESPAFTPEEGVCTWTIQHNLGSESVICSLYLNGSEIEKDVDIVSSNVITIYFNSESNLLAGACKAIILANNGNSGSVDTSNLANISLSNLNNIGKENITNFSAPDWTNMVAISTDFASGADFVAPMDGWVDFAMIHSNTTSGYIQITPYDGDTRLVSVRGGYVGGLDNIVFPVKKGLKFKVEWEAKQQWYWAYWIPAYGNS